MIEKLKIYGAALSVEIFALQLNYPDLSEFGFKAFILQINHTDLWSVIELIIKRAMLFLGVFVAVLTLIKLYLDITKTRLEKRKLHLENQKLEAQ
jgi:hypothetical protein